MKRLSLASVALAATLSACAGGGSSPVSVPHSGGGSTTDASTTATLRITIGKNAGSGSTAMRKKLPQFVSPSSMGAYVQVFDSTGATQLSSLMNDVSPSSQACTANSDGSRTCTIVLNAPPGSDEIQVSLYDSKAVSSSGAPTGDLLGISPKTPETITANQNNGPFSFFVGGVITSINDLPAFASLPADGSTHSLGVIVEPTDFGNNPITAGTNDPYANPITVTLAESGGTGHMKLVLNGTPATTSSVTLSHSTDTLAVSYDGGGAAGYSATLSMSASSVGTSTAPTTRSLVISPLFASATSASGSTISFTSQGQTSTVTLSEANAPANGGETSAVGTYYVTSESGCKGIADSTAPSGTGTSSTAKITSDGGGTCTITYSDGTSSLTFTIDSTTSTGTITVPGAAHANSNFDTFTTGPMVDYTSTYPSGELTGANVGQKGWSGNNCGGNPYDANIVSGNANIPNGHTQALQFSNAVTQGCFSGLATSLTAVPAGVPSSLLDPFSGTSTSCGPTCSPFFGMQFTVTSATGAWQQGLVTSLAPVYGNGGARMSYVALWNTVVGGANTLLVFFVDVEGVYQAPGQPPQASPCFECTNFVAYPVAALDPTIKHTIGLTMAFASPSDTVSVYVDGTKSTVDTTGISGATLGTRSWQDYYQLDTESDPNGANPVSRGVDSVLFRAGNLDGCTADEDPTTGYFGANGCGAGGNPSEAPALQGKGYLFTDVNLCSGTATTCAGTVTGASETRRNTTSVATKRVKGFVLSRKDVKLL